MKTSPLNGVPHLTPRQTQVVMMIAEDLTAEEIGRRLGIPENC